MIRRIGDPTDFLPDAEESGRLPVGSAGRARLRNDYLLHRSLSVQEVYLPVRALDSHIEFAELQGE